MQWTLTLSEPDIGDEEIAAVTRVLRSKWLTAGEVTAEFERSFAQKIDVKHAIAVSNCTAALHLAYCAIGVGHNDEVICPALTFVATANAARYTGAHVVFAGVVSHSDLTVSPEDIERKITGRTRAIAVTHYAGFTCRMDEIKAIAGKHRLSVIEDCAHAPLAWIGDMDGRRTYAGAIGDVGCFSFFGNKNMTVGEGGMVTTNDDALAAKIRLMRSHGMTTVTYDRHRGHASQYDVVCLGYNYRLDEIRSAIGLCQLAKIDRLNAKRRQVYQWYREELAGSTICVAFEGHDLERSACHILTVVVPAPLVPLIKETLRNRGIQTSRHYEPIPSFSLYANGGERWPVFAESEDDLITLPLFAGMSRDDVRLVAEVVRSCEALSPANTQR